MHHLEWTHIQVRCFQKWKAILWQRALIGILINASRFTSCFESKAPSVCQESPPAVQAAPDCEAVHWPGPLWIRPPGCCLAMLCTPAETGARYPHISPLRHLPKRPPHPVWFKMMHCLLLMSSKFNTGHFKQCATCIVGEWCARSVYWT